MQGSTQICQWGECIAMNNMRWKYEFLMVNDGVLTHVSDHIKPVPDMYERGYESFETPNGGTVYINMANVLSVIATRIDSQDATVSKEAYEIGDKVYVPYGDHDAIGKVIWVDELPTGDLTVELEDGSIAEANVEHVSRAEL